MATKTVSITKDTLDNLIVSHLYAMSVLNDNQEVVEVLYPDHNIIGDLSISLIIDKKKARV